MYRYVFGYLSRLALRGFRSRPRGRGGCAKDRLPFGECPRRRHGRAEDFDLKKINSKWINKGTPNYQNGTKGKKGNQKGGKSEPRDIQKHHLRNRVEQMMKTERPNIYLWDPFLITIDRNPILKIKKNDHPKTWNLMPKEFQNGANIDAKTHKDSMQKLVTENIIKIINIMFF